MNEKKGQIILTLKNKVQALNKELENIIKGCQRQKPKSQKQLFDYFGNTMYGICLRYSNNPEDAQDVLQDGFLKVYEKINQYKFNGAFEGWMRRVFVNTALEKYRSQYKIINIQDGWRDVQDYIYDDITSNITAKELISLVQELSPKYRTVFNLYAIEGFAHREISEMLGISEGTSKSNLSRARIILQEKVKKLYGVTSQIMVK